MLVSPPHKRHFWQDLYFSYLHSHVIIQNNTRWSPDNHRIHQVSYKTKLDYSDLLVQEQMSPIFSLDTHHSLKVKVQEGVWVLPAMITLNIFGTEYHFHSFLPTYTICILQYVSDISLHSRPHKHPSIHKITADTIFLKWHFSVGGILLGRCHTISHDSAAINTVTWHYVQCRKI